MSNHKKTRPQKLISKKFYIDKSIKRIDEYLEKNKFENEYINNEKIPLAKDLIYQSENIITNNLLPSKIHGDFILDNIIDTGEDFTLIDWRQDFSGDLYCGDLYYDLAKINHNLTVNHDIVSKGLFNYSPKNCYILCNSTLMKFKHLLHDFIKRKNFSLKKVKVLSSVIWINMAPLHEYPFNKFLFNFGKYNLHKELSNES